MDNRTCAQCGRLWKPDQRGRHCSQRCTWRRRSIARGSEAQQLPLATLPPDTETILPATGPERLLLASQLALISRAPADARGDRGGIQNGKQLMRWFPPRPFPHSADVWNHMRQTNSVTYIGYDGLKSTACREQATAMRPRRQWPKSDFMVR